MAHQRLRLLVVGLNYAPEPTGIAPYTTKLSEGLAARGYAVNVLTGYPNYPWWTRLQGYAGSKMTMQLNGVRIVRLRHSVPHHPKLIRRLAMEISFGLHAVAQRWHRPDVVLSVSPSLLASALVVIKSNLIRVPCAIWVQDLYSRGVEETAGKTGFLTEAAMRLESRILRRADGVFVIHERFRSYAVSRLGLDPDRVSVIRNWTHVLPRDEPDVARLRRELDWPQDKTVVLHTGNMGLKQDLDNVLEAAKNVSVTEGNVHFILVGDGNQRERLQKAASQIPAVSMVGTVSDRQYAAALRAADILLVNEATGLREMSVPSKLTSYFAASRPVIAVTHRDSATAEEIVESGAGMRVDPGRPQKLIAAVRELANDSELARRFSSAGRSYAERVLSESVAINAFAARLAGLAERHQL